MDTEELLKEGCRGLSVSWTEGEVGKEGGTKGAELRKGKRMMVQKAFIWKYGKRRTEEEERGSEGGDGERKTELKG